MSTNVLYLVPEIAGNPGGIARYCRHICDALIETGYSLSVIALLDCRTTNREEPADAQHRFVSCGGSKQRFIQHLLRAIRAKRPDLIIAGHVNLAPAGYLAAQITGAPLVTFIYGIDVFEPLSLLRRFALQHSALVISISRFTAEQAVAMNRVNPNRVRILHNCLDPHFAEAQQTLQQTQATRSQKQCSLLTVARMSRTEQYKGHDYVIRALPHLLKHFPNLVYNIVGGGDGQPVLAQLSKEHQVEQAVCFHGIVSDAELKKHYEQATVFIMPSRREGFGFVFLEAMARGIPVIGGDQDATPEVIIDGKTGYLVNPTSVDEIVTAISNLLTNPHRRGEMGQAGISHVQSKFSYEQFRSTLHAVLDEVIRGSNEDSARYSIAQP